MVDIGHEGFGAGDDTESSKTAREMRIAPRFLISQWVIDRIRPEMPRDVRFQGYFLTSPRVFAMIRLEMPRDVRIRGCFLISRRVLGWFRDARRRASGGQAEQKLVFRSNRTEK